MQGMDIFERIKKEQDGFSKSFKKVADFICSNYEEVAFMSITEVAKRSGVSESVIVRFSAALGYSGFIEMKKNIAEKVKENLKLPNRMTSSSLSENMSANEIMTAVLAKDMENILYTSKEPYNKSFEQIVREIHDAKKVYIIGNRGLYKIAELTELLLTPIGIPCISINAEDSIQFQQLNSMRKNCVLLAFSLPRYSSHTYTAIKIAKKYHCKTIVISDSIFSPDAKAADLSLEITVKSYTYINSYCAIVSMMNAIITAIGVLYKTETLNSLNRLENFLQNFQVIESYSKNNSESEKRISQSKTS